VATLVSFHAHPDDECIVTGGVIAKAAAEGHRVVLVVATRGELGEVDDGFLSPGEELWERRVAETHRAAEVLGVQRVEFLDYRDSGMAGEPTNHNPNAFANADLEEAAERLASILREESAESVTTYDEHGVYGHPDHIQVHRVGIRAAQLAGTPRVYEATVNRDVAIQGMKELADVAAAAGLDLPDLESDPKFGMPASRITTQVDVSGYLDHKRRAMQAHASQISEQSFFLALPPIAFARAFGTEWFIRPGQGPGITETSVLPDAS
jgi:LmbE family N-acetylglucosaminyl deacetylase